MVSTKVKFKKEELLNHLIVDAIQDIKGKNIFSYKTNKKTLITFSNESIGPSEMLKSLSDDFITIPGKGRAESLNVSSAAAIVIARLTNEP